MSAKRGGQIGNTNALKNGSRIEITLGVLPKKMLKVTRYVRHYRRLLTEAVHKDHVPTLTDLHLIDAACTHEQHAKVCYWLLRDRLPTMTTSDIRACSASIAQSKDARNAAVKALKLDRDIEHDVIQALYAPALPESLTNGTSKKTTG
jgi:hypothetical protein